MDLLTSAEKKRKVYKLDLKLTPAQSVIDAHPARFKIVRAGRKFGKTVYSQKKGLDWIGSPGKTHWHIAPTYKMAKLISWSEFKRMIPQEAIAKRPNEQDLSLLLQNGSQLLLMGSDDPDSLRGPAPSSATLEEAPYQRKEVWHEVLRPNLIPKLAPCLFIGTPKGYNWFYDLEQEALRSMARGENKWAVFHYTIFDNPHLSVDEIEDARRSCDSEAIWRQEYLAEYESSVGRVFSALSPEHHVAKLSVPVGKVYRSIDWGMRDDTGVLWADIRSNKLCIYREYADNNLSAPAQAELVKGMTSDAEQVDRTAISHDAAKEDPAMKGLSVIWHFRNAGISPLIPSSRDKKHSRSMIQELLRQNRLLIDKDRCPKLWKQLLMYEWKDTLMEKTDETSAQDLVDALHYLVEMLQYELFLGPYKKELTHDEKAAEYRKEKAALARPHWKVENDEPLGGFQFDKIWDGYFQ